MDDELTTQAPSQGTLPEPGIETEPERTAHLLSPVLCFDDLLRPVPPPVPLPPPGRPLRIGRRAAGQGGEGVAADRLWLDDRWTSTEHAIVELRDGGVLLTDRQSRNGTYCNQERVRERLLADGDLIQIGFTLLCYRAVPAHRAALVLGGAPEVLGPVPTRCPELAHLVRELKKVAPQRDSVLIMGETGAGKEVLAQEVHRLSRRAGELRAVNVGAVPDALFESTFFGHRRGAFTGASDDRDGEIVAAQQGTLFLDEVGTMPHAAQAKLLRVLEDGRVTPIGGGRAIAVDVRWVSATNSDLLGEPEGFRPDLLQRLSGYVVNVPPLRRRREDLGQLSAHFLRQLGLLSKGITPVAGRQLYAGAFPGNIRQLRRTLRVAATLSGDGPIDEEHLRAANQSRASDDRGAEPGAAAAPAQRAERRIERDRLFEVLASTRGNVMHAARLLCVDPRQVYRWIERFELDLSGLRTPLSEKP